jgi:hypothetical protein
MCLQKDASSTITNSRSVQNKVAKKDEEHLNLRSVKEFTCKSNDL